jgi:hypothetical protein
MKLKVSGYTIIGIIAIMVLMNARVWGDQNLQVAEHIFSTWEGLEVDKCASIWLIKRFIDPQALIRFHKKGQFVTEGIVFDTPDAQFRRSHIQSTFESLVAHYKIQDAKVIYLSKIIHDIEINVWEKKRFKETLHILEDINRIILNGGRMDTVLEKSNQYFDQLYRLINYNAD